MKITKGLLLFGVLVVVVSACFSPPEYPNQPSINLAGLDFYAEVDALDSLVLSIDFRDGDGDLGLGADEISYPYHPRNYFLQNNGQLIPIPTTSPYTNIPPIIYLNENQQGKLATNRTLEDPAYSSKMPPYIYPYTCNTYIFDTLYVEKGDEAIFDATYNITDTLRSSNPQNKDLYEIKEIFYTQENPNYDNITVDFILSNGTELDWETITGTECGPSFDGRFPRLSDKTGVPLEGTLRYSMKSEGLAIVLGSQSFKLRVQIKDRALNVSNIIETDYVTLEGIKRKG
ncbi:MAG TPA: hypothetical protein VIN08_01515 [Ohtaekwangia sp.]|uniref:hypothetical protein n=1 Tax=Ohtaekwangia sp. TaxID=2066019 RepID=UPI002F954C07